jgi:methylated-DNA-[protein]-cysteine S-methyltransferase
MHSLPYTAPFGELTLIGSDAGLRAILWPTERPGRVRLDVDTPDTSHPVLGATAAQLDEYFAGTRRAFDLPLDLQGTVFQLKAWRALATISYGATATYTEQARRVGSPTAVRAIGSANGRNPISIVLPCHRVVASNGGLAGFAGGLDTKRWLLTFEAAHAKLG